MSRLSETLLVEAVRHYASTLADQSGSWLNGINDPQVGRALALIHHNIGAQWSAESLAKEVAMSRSAFTDRFTTLVGMPPIRYLTVWRMQTAKLNLREKRNPDRQARAFGRLRIRGSLQPRIQARVRHIAGALARPAAGRLTPRLFQDDLDEQSSDPAARSCARANPRPMSPHS